MAPCGTTHLDPMWRRRGTARPKPPPATLRGWTSSSNPFVSECFWDIWDHHFFFSVQVPVNTFDPYLGSGNIPNSALGLNDERAKGACTIKG